MSNKNTSEVDPFARLEQTHRRLEERIAEMLESVEELASKDEARRKEALEIIDETIGFFSRGGRRHVEDEEETLFPRLRRFKEIESLMKKLAEEHEAHQRVEESLRVLFASFRGKDPDRGAETRLKDLAHQLATLYGDHIAREENELFPMCKKLLSADEIQSMGEEMMARRPDRGKDKR